MDNLLLDSYIDAVSALIENDWKGRGREIPFDANICWPADSGRILLSSDTAVELGSPRTESSSFFLCTSDHEKIQDGKITLIGPDLNETDSRQLPFGKVVLLAGHDFTEDNFFDRYQELNRLRFRLSLYGYMMRAVLQENKEWSRVGKDALRKGFSFRVLGSELIRAMKSLDYIDRASVIFVTASEEDVRKLKPIGDKANKVMRAMNKVFEKIDCDCASCDYSDVCSEVEGLKKLHEKVHA